jgi:nucleoside-diphosphate-sugar epimerase
MAILVTGGSGYVGLNVVEALARAGREVVSFDMTLPPPVAAVELSRLPGRVHAVDGDLLDAGALDRAFHAAPIEAVVHTAAVTSGPAREASDPARVFQVNVIGTIGLLEAARRAGVNRVVVTSSGAAYGESLYRPGLMEEDATPVLPTTLYATTKYAAERTVRRLAELWRMEVACTRLGTLIGPWERDGSSHAQGVRDNFGPHSQLARIAVAGGEAVLPAEECTRDWVYSADVGRALVMLADAPSLPHAVYNLSAGIDWTGDIAAWCEVLAARFPGFRHRTAQPGEVPSIHYTDRARSLMSVRRLETDHGFVAMRDRAAIHHAFADWVGQVGRVWYAS